MPRYFIEVAYKGTQYSGFQIQENAVTVQSEIEKALRILLPAQIFTSAAGGSFLTGSSRTDAGVHALQNFFHFEAGSAPQGITLQLAADTARIIYKLNAILPADIVVKNIHPVNDDMHCRFHAISREYKYFVYQQKNPFLKESAYYYPFKINLQAMQEAAEVLKTYTDFTSFSKRNTQVRSFNCQILESKWQLQDGCFVYNVVANRFLRGMVRALTATMLKVGRGTLTLADFKTIIEAKDCTKASFAAPAHGLFLIKVSYPFDFQ